MKQNKTQMYVSVAVALVVTFGLLWMTGLVFPGGSQVELFKGVTSGSVEPIDTEIKIIPRLETTINFAVSEDLGEYVVSTSGRTLYTTVKENCEGRCISVWSPYITDVEVIDGDLGTVFREDIGFYQFTWKGEALYYYDQDRFPGQVEGHEFGGEWFVARPVVITYKI